jgi:hypothetical protein
MEQDLVYESDTIKESYEQNYIVVCKMLWIEEIQEYRWWVKEFTYLLLILEV